MSLELVAILGTLIVHFLGAGVLVYALLDGEQVDWRGTLWPRDDDGGGGPGYEPPAKDPSPGGGDGLMPPLSDAAPSGVRLREPGQRIADGYDRPPRRPEHAPQPARPTVPSR